MILKLINFVSGCHNTVIMRNSIRNYLSSNKLSYSMWYTFAGSNSGSFVFKYTFLNIHTHTDHRMHFAVYSTFTEHSNASIYK